MANIDQTIKALDPNSCLYMEATKGDQGKHTDPTFWLSSDVQMCNIDPMHDPCTGGIDQCMGDHGLATAGKSNLTYVQVHWKPSCQISGGGGELASVVYELFVGDASLLMTTGLNTGNTKDLTKGAKPISGIAPGGVGHACFTWDPAAVGLGTGHKCMIARCYPFDINTTFTSPELSIFVVDDQHYAQHNLHVEVAGGGTPMPLRIQVKTGNTGAEAAVVTIDVVQDFHPSASVLQAILPSLQTVQGFKRIATTPVRHMSLDFGPFTGEDQDFDEKLEVIGNLIIDKITGLFGRKPQPNLEARLPIPANFFAAFAFLVDATGSNAGDAHLFHLTQKNQRGEFEGGLTVAVVTV
jgi:hypothetical protein